MRKITAYRLFLIWTLTVVLIVIALLLVKMIQKKVPETIQIMVGEEQEFNFDIPAVGLLYKEVSTVDANSEAPAYRQSPDCLRWNLNQRATIITNVTDRYQMEVRLFGILPIKTVTVSVVDKQLLIPVGKSIGIYVKTQGVMIIEVGSFTGDDGLEKAPGKYILKEGDYIQKMNGIPVERKSDVTDIINNCNGEMVILEINRNGEIMETAVRALRNEWGEYKLGIWIRDSAQGIGTMTFLTADGRFGALGHGITDTDTGDLMKLSEGVLYTTQIAAIRKGFEGSVGEITGIIHYSDGDILGNIFINSNRGIYGKSTDLLTDEIGYDPICPAMKQEIELGPATILSDVSGEVSEYNVEIIAISIEGELAGHQMMIQVKDDRLIRLTGGIVQGMSGSPIIQNGKLVGAVTHVLVNDSTKGYGISIENMLAIMETTTADAID